MTSEQEQANGPPSALNASEQGDEPGVSPAKEAPARRSPEVAFDELRRSVERLSANVAPLVTQVEDTHRFLEQHAEGLRSEGRYAVLQSLARVHDLLFQRAMELGTKAQRAGFLDTLYRAVESELASHGVEVILPVAGDELDLRVMTAVGQVRPHAWQRDGRVARATRCAYVVDGPDGPMVLEKAQVIVLHDVRRDDKDQA